MYVCIYCCYYCYSFVCPIGFAVCDPSQHKPENRPPLQRPLSVSYVLFIKRSIHRFTYIYIYMYTFNVHLPHTHPSAPFF